MTATDRFPHHRFSGDAQARGIAYGATLGTRIRETFAFYQERLFKHSRLSPPAFEERAEHVRTLVSAFDRTIVDELDAIATGADLPRWQIYLLNARTEILNASVSECTAVCFPDSRLLGQTWDWFEGFNELTVMVSYEPADGPSVLAFTEPGMLAKIGLNEHGLGICLNFLDCPHRLNGVPVHILIRSILNQASVGSVCEVVRRAGFGKASHFLIADQSGKATSIEFIGAALREVGRYADVYVHTNHCVYAGAPDPGRSNGFKRRTDGAGPSTHRRASSVITRRYENDINRWCERRSRYR